MNRRQPFIELGVFVAMVLGFYAYMHWQQVRPCKMQAACSTGGGMAACQSPQRD